MFFSAELLGKLFDHGWVVLCAAIAALWRHLINSIKNAKRDSMSHAESLVAAQAATVKAVQDEVMRQRDVSAKIFDKLDEMQRDAAISREKAARENADRHERLLLALHNGLAGKADK